MWNLKSDRNELIYKIEADHRLKLKPKAQIFGSGEKVRDRDRLGVCDDKHTLLYLK